MYILVCMYVHIYVNVLYFFEYNVGDIQGRTQDFLKGRARAEIFINSG